MQTTRIQDINIHISVDQRSSYEKAVCPSVKRVDCDKTEERYVPIFLYNTKDHLA